MSATCLPSHHSSFADLAILGLLSSNSSHPFDLKSIVSTSVFPNNSQRYRRPQLDPLILETAALSSPLQTRNHYLHEYFPHSQHLHHHHRLQQQHNVTNKQPKIVSSSTVQSPTTPLPSRADANYDPSDLPARLPPPSSVPAPDLGKVEMKFVPDPMGQQPADATLQAALAGLRASLAGPSPTLARPSSGLSVTVQCEARTRIPSAEGAVWLHLYTNTADGKEHLAFVVDGGGPGAIWSRTLDAPRGPGETALDRAIRGASVTGSRPCADAPGHEAPVVRIHSECFTGETLGSRRCDCGEQLRTALVHIARTPPHKGCVIYLRQEGRGIGLLNKLKAYNLQDLGFDTFEANLLLGFPPDARNYQVAVKVLEDLGLGRVRLMTNNPDKVEALEMCGGTVQVVERIPMVPSHWQVTHPAKRSEGAEAQSDDKKLEGAELDRYLRTKVTRMRHLIPVPPLSTSALTSSAHEESLLSSTSCLGVSLTR